MANIVIIQASPRSTGVSQAVAEHLLSKLTQRFPNSTFECLSIAQMNIQGCTGCAYCATHSRCCLPDNMDNYRHMLEQTQAVFIVSPVYFSGAPAQFKAFLDRFQPFYWQRFAYKKTHNNLPPKRPAFLYVIGDGNDPHGHDSLVREVSSAFALANFKVSVAQELIGYSTLPHAEQALASVVSLHDEQMLERVLS